MECINVHVFWIPSGYEYYKELKKQALKAVLVPHTTLYLDVPPETCNQRIRGRGRVCHSNAFISHKWSVGFVPECSYELEL